MKTQPIYEILKREHEEVAEILRRLARARGAEASELLTELKLKLVPHSRSEEAVFYSRLLEERATERKARESLEEHRQVDVLLDELEELPVRDESWSAKAHVLAEMIGRHVDEEEGELFPLARQILDAREAVRIAEQFEGERERVREELTRAEEELAGRDE